MVSDSDEWKVLMGNGVNKASSDLLTLGDNKYHLLGSLNLNLLGLEFSLISACPESVNTTLEEEESPSNSDPWTYPGSSNRIEDRAIRPTVTFMMSVTLR